MNKILGIVVLGLLLCGNVLSSDKVELLEKGVTVNDLLNEGYTLSSTNVVPPNDFDGVRVFYHLVKEKQLATCILQNDEEDVGKIIVFCIKP